MKMCSSKPTEWLQDSRRYNHNCIKCIIKQGTAEIKKEYIDGDEKSPLNPVSIRSMNECREKMLIECDPPEFDDCIRLDRKCYDVARELDEQKKLTKAKSSLLAQRKREHMMVKMFGQGYWRKK